MRKLYHPARDDITLAEVLYALSDPLRLKIVSVLAETKEKSCGTFGADIMGMDIAKSTFSHHCKVLREAGVVRTRSESTYNFLSLRREDLEARFPGLIDVILKAYALSEGVDEHVHAYATE
jgi:DNA-binding transcriptional ArsR family regulator